MRTRSIRFRLFVARANERANVLHLRFVNADIGDGAPRLTHRADMRIAGIARAIGLSREPDGAGGVRFVRPLPRRSGIRAGRGRNT